MSSKPPAYFDPKAGRATATLKKVKSDQSIIVLCKEDREWLATELSTMFDKIKKLEKENQDLKAEVSRLSEMTSHATVREHPSSALLINPCCPRIIIGSLTDPLQLDAPAFPRPREIHPALRDCPRIPPFQRSRDSFYPECSSSSTAPPPTVTSPSSAHSSTFDVADRSSSESSLSFSATGTRNHSASSSATNRQAQAAAAAKSALRRKI
ncbi:hypothetical protein MMC14_007832 [Varicellaria rhodocarpa]|nr:hypothetical protein [Varicellaria rhodocarpa]